MKNKVIVGMSGGVDSSVAAALLLEQGYKVIGVAINILPDSYCSQNITQDAKAVCDKLGISFYQLDFQQTFKDKVINYFIDEYLNAKTPNPCIECNKYVKFKALLEKANELNAQYISTGHYAKVEFDENKKRFLVKKSVDTNKDQTYMLYNLTQEQLQRTLMPLGYYTKDYVREIARQLDLNVATKSESQEICFVQDNNYAKFIRNNTDYKVQPGNFVDINGNIIGKHKGIIHYTIGQRKGLGISFGKPMYVVGIDYKNNDVILGDDKEVFCDELIANTVNFVPFDDLNQSIKVNTKTRYTAKEASSVIYPLENSKVKVKFDKPQRAITPGQAVVFYDNDILVGGGTIE